MTDKVKCHVCGNISFHEKIVQETFNIDGHLVLVENIPARVCSRCGEASFDHTTAENIRLMVHGAKRPSHQMSVDVFAYA